MTSPPAAPHRAPSQALVRTDVTRFDSQAPAPVPPPNHEAFERAGDLARRLADEQAECVETEQLEGGAYDQAANRAAGDDPGAEAAGQRDSGRDAGTPIKATRIVTHKRTRSTEAAPMPGWSGWEAPMKP